MPKITNPDPSLRGLRGLHLWHAPLSSCSQRVRLTLVETKRDFVSHLIDLERGEHASEAYQKIHPKGLVPALVDDGELYTESIDIIQHLARGHAGLLADVDPDLLALADASQLDLKLLTFEYLFRGAPTPPDDVARAFQEAHRNEWLKQFYQDFAVGFAPSRVKAAVVRTAEGFAKVDSVLADGRKYLSGDEFTLADIAWLPNVHRFDLMGWDWGRTPYLLRWFKTVSMRTSYDTALVRWENPDARQMFRSYTETRLSEGTDISVLIP